MPIARPVCGATISKNTTRARADVYVVPAFLGRQYICKRAFDGRVVDM